MPIVDSSRTPEEPEEKKNAESETPPAQTPAEGADETDLSKESFEGDELWSQLDSIMKKVERERDLLETFIDPRTPADERAKMIVEILQNAEGDRLIKPVIHGLFSGSWPIVKAIVRYFEDASQTPEPLDKVLKKLLLHEDKFVSRAAQQILKELDYAFGNITAKLEAVSAQVDIFIDPLVAPEQKVRILKRLAGAPGVDVEKVIVHGLFSNSKRLRDATVKFMGAMEDHPKVQEVAAELAQSPNANVCEAAKHFLGVD